ncbi:hypothetical protein [Calidifontibacter terrae]
MLWVVVVLLGGAAVALFRTAAVEKARWEDHRRQVALMRRWEQSRAGGPFDQNAKPMPTVTSPYARPSSEDPPTLPPQPGQTRVLWGWLVVACALLALAAAIASS